MRLAVFQREAAIGPGNKLDLQGQRTFIEPAPLRVREERPAAQRQRRRWFSSRPAAAKIASTKTMMRSTIAIIRAAL